MSQLFGFPQHILLFSLRFTVWIIMVREENTNKHRRVSVRRFALICILQHGKRHLSTKTFVPAVWLLKDGREFRVFMRSSWQKREEIWSLQELLYSEIMWILGMTGHVYLFIKGTAGNISTILFSVITS